jgi:hypothetical protein
MDDRDAEANQWFWDRAPSPNDLPHVCWIDDSMCFECGALTISEAIKSEMMDSKSRITQVQALDRLIRDVFVYGHTFYTSSGHPIPLSSYLPRKDDLSDIPS